jgi:hypothetical protein
VVLRQVIDSLRLVFIPSEPVTRQTILTTYRDMIGQLAGTGHSRLLHHLIAQTAEIAAGLDATAEQDEADACLDLLEAVGIQAASCGLMPVVRRAGQSLAALGAASALRSPATGSETVTRILRIERAVDRRERETIAALEFARVEVERATPSRPPEAVQRESQAESHESAVSGFEELWDEPDK